MQNNRNVILVFVSALVITCMCVVLIIAIAASMYIFAPNAGLFGSIALLA